MIENLLFEIAQANYLRMRGQYFDAVPCILTCVLSLVHHDNRVATRYQLQDQWASTQQFDSFGGEEIESNFSLFIE